MPFQSKAQRGFMYANHPKIAKEFEEATPKDAKLPEHVKMTDGGPVRPLDPNVPGLPGVPELPGVPNKRLNIPRHAEGGAVDEREFEDPVPGPSERLGVYNGKDGKKHVEHVMTAANGGYAEELEPGIYGDTDPGHMKAIVDSLGSGMATGALAGGLAEAAPKAVDALKGLGEDGQISIFSKGLMGKGTPNEMNIWGAKGTPEELAQEFGDSDPGSIPEHILRNKGLLPGMKAPSQEPSLEANELRHLWADIADQQSGTPLAVRGHYERPDLFNKPKNYAEGGMADNTDVSDSGDWKDKLSAVLSAMGMAGKAATGPLGPTGALPQAVAPAAAATAQAPGMADVVNAAIPAANVQGPAPTPPAPSMPVPPPQSAPTIPAPQPTPQMGGQNQPVSDGKPSALDLLSKMTGNDSAKMAQLMEQLKDQDKRTQVAQVLGMIGDTFGNAGQAKAGMTPSGFTSTAMLGQMGEANRNKIKENAGQALNSDPNSQTSRMAQQTLMQAMGIKQGDPRSAAILKMPAAAITQMIPQMTDAVKNNIEKEKNMIEARKATAEEALKKQMAEYSGEAQAREARTAETTAANETLKNIGPVSGLANPGVRQAALNTLQRNMGGGQAGGQTLTATNKMGHRIQSSDGGKTWHPMQ